MAGLRYRSATRFTTRLFSRPESLYRPATLTPPLDERDVEERNPTLEARRHRHSVDAVQRAAHVSQQLVSRQRGYDVRRPIAPARAGSDARRTRPRSGSAERRAARSGLTYAELSRIASSRPSRRLLATFAGRWPGPRPRWRRRALCEPHAGEWLGYTAPARDVVARIAAKQLVGAFAGQYDRHVLARESTQLVQGNRVRMAQRFVMMSHQEGQQPQELARLGDDDVMVGLDARCRVGREARARPMPDRRIRRRRSAACGATQMPRTCSRARNRRRRYKTCRAARRS